MIIFYTSSEMGVMEIAVMKRKQTNEQNKSQHISQEVYDATDVRRA